MYPCEPNTSRPNEGDGHSCNAIMSGDDERHSSRIRNGARFTRCAGSGAIQEGLALDTFHERKVSGMLLFTQWLDDATILGMRPIVVDFISALNNPTSSRSGLPLTFFLISQQIISTTQQIGTTIPPRDDDDHLTTNFVLVLPLSCEQSDCPVSLCIIDVGLAHTPFLSSLFAWFYEYKTYFCA